MLLPLPPLQEQEEIAKEVERRLSVVDAIESQIGANFKRATRLRQSILKRAFEGKLVPQDPTGEPANIFFDRIRQERKATNADGKKPKRTGHTRRPKVK